VDFVDPRGISDFRHLRERGATYVDKTDFISRVLRLGGQVKLLPRPRRFGKTLNLSALRAFVEQSPVDATELFEGLAVWEDAGARAHFQRYPVVHLTFKDTRHDAWPDCLEAIALVVARAFDAHAEALATLSGGAAEQADAVRRGHASPAALADSLRALVATLHAHHGERVFVLIDEYDAPIHAGYVHGYYDRVIGFFRNFLSGGFKDNPHLEQGVITGILRVAKESVFSGLNNLAVYSLLQPEFAPCFGFTEPEVKRIAVLSGSTAHLETIRRWYDGYQVAGQTLYNPWSVLSFCSSEAKRPVPYWAQTSANELLRDLVVGGGLGDPGDLQTLLEGGSVRRRVLENLVFRDLPRDSAAVWSLLFFSGYLTAESVEIDGHYDATLRIPNREVRAIFQDVLLGWMQQGLGGTSAVEALGRALLEGDTRSFEGLLGALLRDVMSFHDFGREPRERVYHAFLAGLLLHLQPDWQVRSNRESGFGRVDVLVAPKTPGKPGVVMELKVLREGETVEASLDAAVRQLADRGYAAELVARGADPVMELAVVFDGKRVHVRA